MVNGKKVIAIIPARGGSKSIPRKNIKLLGGHPLLAYSVAAGLQSKYVDRVIVSTDDEKIAETAKRYGAEIPFLRPARFAQDNTTDFPVIKHALDWLAKNENYMPEFIVQLRPTSPFRPINLVDEAIQILAENPDGDSVRGVTPSGQNPYKMWRIENDEMKPLLESEFSEPYNMPRQKLPSTYWQTGHIDVIRRNSVINKNSLSGDMILPVIIDSTYAIDIDTPKDWAFAEWIMKNGDLQIARPEQSLFSIFENIKMIVFDFDGVFTDNNVYVMQDGTEAVLCNRGDGMGISKLRKKGIKLAVLSTEINPVVSARCTKLNIPCTQGAEVKISIFKDLVSSHDLTMENVIFVGNDINDIECMEAAKFSVTVADAHPTALNAADWILSKAGGQGAVRELCDLFLSYLNEC